MPELPEVETIRRQLVTSVRGAVVTGVVVRRVSCYVGGELKASEIIEKITRTGKYLYIHFTSGRGFAIHLKMTGRLVVNVDAYDALPHTRVVISLGDGRKVYYWDARTFGYVKYVDDIASEQKRQEGKLGPDPWQITDESFHLLCKKYQRPIKT